MKAAGIIPARYASTRFPGKPLAPIAGKPMIQWVYEQAEKASSLSQVVVATDDERIATAVESFGGEVLMTSPDHACGTDRLAEVARTMAHIDVVVNIQGDEPLIAPASIDLAVNALLDRPEASMSTLAVLASAEERDNPNVVKVVIDTLGFALYFSRSPIPYFRTAPGQTWKHLGLYAYRREFLLEFADTAQTPLEKAESLEQLRALEMGKRIACVLSPYGSIGVDAPEDVPAAEKALRTRAGG